MRLTNAVAVGGAPIRYPIRTPPAVLVLATLPPTQRAASYMTGMCFSFVSQRPFLKLYHR